MQHFAQKGARNFAESSIHVLSNDVNVSQGTTSSHRSICPYNVRGINPDRTPEGGCSSQSTASAWGLSLRLGQRETVSLPAEGVQWYRICVAKEVQEEVSRLRGIRDGEKENNRIFFKTLQPEPSAVLKEDEVICAYWVRKWQRLEAYDFWQQEEGSCSTCISPTKEQIQYPRSR